MKGYTDLFMSAVIGPGGQTFCTCFVIFTLSAFKLSNVTLFTLSDGHCGVFYEATVKINKNMMTLPLNSTK